MVQAGPNTQFGGEKEGFVSVWYQPGMADRVKGVAAIPINSQPIVEIKNFESFFTYI